MNDDRNTPQKIIVRQLALQLCLKTPFFSEGQTFVFFDYMNVLEQWCVELVQNGCEYEPLLECAFSYSDEAFEQVIKRFDFIVLNLFDTFLFYCAYRLDCFESLESEVKTLHVADKINDAFPSAEFLLNLRSGYQATFISDLIDIAYTLKDYREELLDALKMKKNLDKIKKSEKCTLNYYCSLYSLEQLKRMLSEIEMEITEKYNFVVNDIKSRVRCIMQTHDFTSY